MNSCWGPGGLGLKASHFPRHLQQRIYPSKSRERLSCFQMGLGLWLLPPPPAQALTSFPPAVNKGFRFPLAPCGCKSEPSDQSEAKPITEPVRICITTKNSAFGVFENFLERRRHQCQLARQTLVRCLLPHPVRLRPKSDVRAKAKVHAV